MPPIIKCQGYYGMAYASVSINILSFIGQTPGSIDPIFLCSLLGVTRERFLSMISSAAHPRWPLRPPSWIWFPSITGQTRGSVDLIIMRFIGGDLLMMATTAAILDFISVD
jgi:hypothetical protein